VTRKHPGKQVARPVARALAARTDWSEAEILAFMGIAVGVATVVGSVVAALRAIDVLVDNWPFGDD
jgi:hypothetical protein